MAWFKRADPAPYMPVADSQQQQQPQEPQYVPVAQFNSALEEVKQLGSKFDQFTGMMAGMLAGSPGAQTQPVASAEPDIDDITDEEYNDAVLRGDAVRIAKRTNAMVERATRRVQKDLGGRIDTLQTQGMGILNQVNTELGQQALGGQPYYQLLKAEIDMQLQEVPAHQRTPQMRQWIYERTVGANIAKIREHDTREAERQARDRDALGTPGRARQQQDTTPTAESTFGDGVMRNDATWHGGGRVWEKKSPDDFARRRYGLDNMNQAAVFATNVMAVSDCSECFMPIVGGKCAPRCSRTQGAT